MLLQKSFNSGPISDIKSPIFNKEKIRSQFGTYIKFEKSAPRVFCCVPGLSMILGCMEWTLDNWTTTSSYQKEQKGEGGIT